MDGSLHYLLHCRLYHWLHCRLGHGTRCQLRLDWLLRRCLDGLWLYWGALDWCMVQRAGTGRGPLHRKLCHRSAILNMLPVNGLHKVRLIWLGLGSMMALNMMVIRKPSLDWAMAGLIRSGCGCLPLQWLLLLLGLRLMQPWLRWLLVPLNLLLLNLWVLLTLMLLLMYSRLLVDRL